MTSRLGSARTRVGSGRFVFLCLLINGCQLAGLATPEASQGSLAEPIVAPGPISRAEQRTAADLYARAQRSFEGRRFLEVLRLTAELLRRVPASDVSGGALLLSARAEYESGALDRADAAAERYIGLLPPGDPRAAEVRLFQTEVLAGRHAMQLDRLLRIETLSGAADLRRALGLVRSAADSLTLGNTEGKTIEIVRRDIDVIRRQQKSTMPEDVEKRLSEREFLDLIAFLLSQKKLANK